MADSNRKCANPECRMSLAGHKWHAQTCSPRCRKAVWRSNHKGEIRRGKLKRPPTLTIPGMDTPNDPHTPRRRRAKK